MGPGIFGCFGHDVAHRPRMIHELGDCSGAAHGVEFVDAQFADFVVQLGHRTPLFVSGEGSFPPPVMTGVRGEVTGHCDGHHKIGVRAETQAREGLGVMNPRHSYGDKTSIDCGHLPTESLT